MNTFHSRASLPRLRVVLVAAALLAVPSFGQTHSILPPDSPTVPASPPSSANKDKRVLWIIPNYRTVTKPAVYQPITARQKFNLAAADSFDRGTFALAAIFAGAGQLDKSNPSFGNGVPAYARYFATSYADFAIGDFMTEGIFPSLLHQDPRYFRRGTGSGFARLGYAVGQIFWTHSDSGGTQFNYSEIGGNATAVAISNAYYPDSRDAGSAAQKLGSQIGIDMASNVLKEFWPDLRKKLSRQSPRSFTVKQP